ncbi:MAG: hypothetical protein QHH15_00800 [Candidatus Thermoplasmatota archaeon]|jgi:hypothetical protein|nr:hypothetical protein [Candidatus Thermoplasmatota archaeon]
MRWDKIFKNYKNFLNMENPFDKAIIEAVDDCKLKIDVVFLKK